jgi:hypothetical protein
MKEIEKIVIQDDDMHVEELSYANLQVIQKSIMTLVQ